MYSFGDVRKVCIFVSNIYRMNLTTQSLRDLGPCYDPTEYFPENWEGTLQDILKDDRIPAKDRIWAFSKVAPESKCREFARWCALQVVDLWDAPEVVREYLETGNENLRAASRSTSWAASWAAALTARAAATATWSATWSAARDAAYDASRSAAWAATEQAQLQKALELVNQEA